MQGRPQPRSVGGWQLIILGSCCAAPAPYAAVQSVVSAATMPLWPYSKMTERAPDVRFAAQPSQRPPDPALDGPFRITVVTRTGQPTQFPGPARFATVALRAPLAQLAEQLTLNQRVGGSIPSRRTNLLVRIRL